MLVISGLHNNDGSVWEGIGWCIVSVLSISQSRGSWGLSQYVYHHSWLQQQTKVVLPYHNNKNHHNDTKITMRFRDDQQILNYHDAVVYGSDLRIVQSDNAWLNDACIHFYMNILQYSANDEHAHQQLKTCHRFVDPSVMSFFMHQCTDEDDMEDFKKGFDLPIDGKLFIPVNDNMKLGANWITPKSGTHWSLLAIALEKGIAVSTWHFDSIRSSGNINAAGDILNKLSLVFPASIPSNEKSKLIQAKAPQQTNCNDCGVHTLATSMLLSTMNGADLTKHEERIQDYVKSKPSFCKSMRAIIASEMIQQASMKLIEWIIMSGNDSNKYSAIIILCEATVLYLFILLIETITVVGMKRLFLRLNQLPTRQCRWPVIIKTIALCSNTNKTFRPNLVKLENISELRFFFLRSTVNRIRISIYGSAIYVCTAKIEKTRSLNT